MFDREANPALELNGLSLRYGRQVVIRDLSLTLSCGEIGCVLGASGCGKTTLLRAIAGLERPSQGQVRLHRQLLSGDDHLVAPERRGIGMVFQDCALFPHLRVDENIVFGINAGAPQQRRRLEELAVMLGLQPLLHKYPHQISGGQQQRVALARAIAPGPVLLLLDEPLSSLDPELQEHLAHELCALLKHEGITALMASHNQQEVFAMTDRLGVIRDGQLLQWGTPFQVYHRPEHIYVADFVGEGSLLPGRVLDASRVQTSLGTIADDKPHGFPVGAAVRVLIRPDDVLHEDHSELKAIVVDKVFRGATFLYTLALDNGDQVYSLIPSHHDHALNEPIGIRLEIDHLVVFPAADSPVSPSAAEGMPTAPEGA